MRLSYPEQRLRIQKQKPQLLPIRMVEGLGWPMRPSRSVTTVNVER
jgi:hypothetical protein